jgi:endoglucanase
VSRTLAVAVAGVAAAALLAVLLLSGGRPATPGQRAQAAAERFLDGYVDGDGRVVRRDQGGDTVSEGQAYALLLAVAIGDQERFDQVWGWTRAHLQQPDGLLAWRWAGGRVTDAQPAADADLDAARALALADRRWGAGAYGAAARRLAGAILASETVTSGGDPVVVAGPWARGPRMVNPSYLSPRAAALLAAWDPRWAAVARSSRRLADKLTAGGLPPDWAQLDPYGISPAPAPGTGEQPRYGYDALRLPLRFAESCDPEDRAIAARLWPRLQAAAGVPVRGLDGRPAAGGESAPALAGAAGAAQAAGDRAAASRLLDQADASEADHSTYYGAAWVALARTMLDTGALGHCPVDRTPGNAR